MGVAWQYVDILTELGLFEGGSASILDIGSSNLYSADAGNIVNFIRRFNPNPRRDLLSFADRLAYGAAYDPVHGGRNGSFLGELLEEAGFHYDAIDIAKGYKTTIVDLNLENIPSKMKNRYSLVINSGTTEHILNQYNSFKNIHDATKSGGFIWHSVPAIGYLDHGYFCYTGKFFLDLAQFNDYEILDMWLDGPGGHEQAFASFSNAGSKIGSASKRLARIGSDKRETEIAALDIPTVGISFIYRKRHDRPFSCVLETSTSVGAIPSSVTSSYVIGQDAQPCHAASPKMSLWSKFRKLARS